MTPATHTAAHGFALREGRTPQARAAAYLAACRLHCMARSHWIDWQHLQRAEEWAQDAKEKTR